MASIASELKQAVERFCSKHSALLDSLAGIRLSEDRWSLKEIIGHLIDSASNNHQRFVRLQLTDRLQFPGYGKDNERWLRLERHNELAWSDLLALWRSYNLLLAHIIQHLDPESLSHVWVAEDREATLSELTTGYLTHLQDHLEHFERRLLELRQQGTGDAGL
jgi:hypothetical protein